MYARARARTHTHQKAKVFCRISKWEKEQNKEMCVWTLPSTFPVLTQWNEVNQSTAPTSTSWCLTGVCRLHDLHDFFSSKTRLRISDCRGVSAITDCRVSFACIQVGVTDFTACCGLNQTVCVWAILIYECFLEVTEGGHPCCDWVILTFGPWPARRFQKNILLPCQLTIGTQTQQWGLKQS